MTPLAGVFLGALVTLATVALAWQWRHRDTEFGVTQREEERVHAAVGRRRLVKALEGRLFSLLSDHAVGGDSAPGDWLRHRVRTYEDGEYIGASTSEDGWTFWIGTGHKWWGSLNRTEARSLAWFILWTWWVRAEWCGLRRWLWFRLLHRRVERWKRERARDGGAA